MNPAPLIPPAKPGGRPQNRSIRTILDGLFYVLRSGCVRRLLPHAFLPWQTVYHYARLFRLDGTGEQLNSALRERERVRLGPVATGQERVPGDSTSHVVERTFSWLLQSRRLSRKYERLCETSEAMIYASMTRIMVQQLAPHFHHHLTRLRAVAPRS